jgi:hypothetical protein
MIKPQRQQGQSVQKTASETYSHSLHNQPHLSEQDCEAVMNTLQLFNCDSIVVMNASKQIYEQLHYRIFVDSDIPEPTDYPLYDATVGKR